MRRKTIAQLEQDLRFHQNIVAWRKLRKEFERRKPGSGCGRRTTATRTATAKPRGKLVTYRYSNASGARRTIVCKAGTSAEAAAKKVESLLAGRRGRARNGFATATLR